MAPDTPRTTGDDVADRPLQPQIDELMDAVTPVELRPLIDELVAHLRDTGSAPGLDVGDAAPDFTLPDHRGRPVTLSDRLQHGPVVLSFYRGDWCPVCNLELQALQANLAEIERRGASLLAVSPQPADTSGAFADRLELAFDVLSDVDQDVARAYALRFPLTDGLRAAYESYGLVLPEQNADGSWCLPVPATFVIDPAAVVQARHVEPDYRRRLEPAEILAALDAVASVGG